VRENRFAQLRAVKSFVLSQLNGKLVNFSLQRFRELRDFLIDQFPRAHKLFIARLRLGVNLNALIVPVEGKCGSHLGLSDRSFVRAFPGIERLEQ